MFSKLPKRKKPNDPVLASDWNLILDALEMRTPLPTSIDDLALQLTSKGFYYRLKKLVQSEQGLYCPFGQVARWSEGGVSKQGVKGGVVQIGPDTWNVPDHEVDPTVAGEWLVSLSVACVSRRDNDNAIFLPGILSSSAPTWVLTPYTGTESYPSDDPPQLADGTGTAKPACGVLTVTIPPGSPPGTVGVLTMTPAACGGWNISQCAGSFTKERIANYFYEDPYGGF